jgi:hypothetical protein
MAHSLAQTRLGVRATGRTLATTCLLGPPTHPDVSQPCLWTRRTLALLPVDDVVWDRGYSQLRPERISHPLHAAGIEHTFRPKGAQRATVPFSEHALVVEGQLFSAHLPPELRGPLEMPPIGPTDAESREYEKPFNRRARFRYQRHARPDADDHTRWTCPVHAGFLRSPALPKSIRRSRELPLLELAEGARCCGGIVSVSLMDLPHRQRLSPGTTAWRLSMGRRQVAEGANAGLKGGFTNIGRKFLRVMGRVKTMMLLSFTIAGYNRDRIRSFVARRAQDAVAPKRRARRRKSTLGDILIAARPTSGRSPP